MFTLFCSYIKPLQNVEGKRFVPTHFLLISRSTRSAVLIESQQRRIGLKPEAASCEKIESWAFAVTVCLFVE